MMDDHAPSGHWSLTSAQICPARSAVEPRTGALGGHPALPVAGTDARPVTFEFLLLPGASMLSFSAAVEPLRMANMLGAQTAYLWRTVSLDGKPVLFSNGMNASVDDRLGRGKADFAFVVAGSRLERRQERASAHWLYAMLRSGARIGSISGGAQILARAGLLADRDFTLHWEDRLGFSERHPDLHPHDCLFCADDRVITCGGGAAATDLMLHLIAADHGHRFTLTIADMCVHSGIRQAEERPQSSLSLTVGSRNPHLIAAARIMADNLEEPLKLDVLAKRVGKSRRQLERLFTTHTNCTLAKFYKDLRLERGRKLLRDTDYKIATISAACGFTNATAFSRSFQKKYGIRPVQFGRV